MGEPRWTDERVAQLRRLWLDSTKSTREIAALIGAASKSAVIGKADRLDLPPRKRAPLRGWQPIETAPENISVLIFIPNAEHYGHGVYRGMLINMGTGRRWSANAVSMGRDLGRDTQPTHWMPLPAPPVTT